MFRRNDVRALYTAASGMQAQQSRSRYHCQRSGQLQHGRFSQQPHAQFQDLIYQNIVMPGAAASHNYGRRRAAGGTRTRTSASEVLQIQGDLSATGNQLDLALEGQGFFSALPNQLA